MYMVWAGFCFYYFYAFPLTQFSFYLSYVLFDFPIFHLSTILRGNHFVILAIPGCVIYSLCRFSYWPPMFFPRGWLDLLAWYHRSFFCSSAEPSLDPPAVLVVFVNPKKQKHSKTSASVVVWNIPKRLWYTKPHRTFNSRNRLQKSAWRRRSE